MIGIQAFTEQLLEAIKKKMGHDWRITRSDSLKNNGVEDIGLAIQEEGNEIGLRFSVKAYYQNYINGSCKGGTDRLADEIIQEYQQKIKAADKDISGKSLDLLSFDAVKDKIYMKLINTDWNRKLLETTPHIPFLDLSVVFYLLLEKTEEGNRIVHIQEEHICQWEVSPQRLYKEALKNMQEQQPAQLIPLEDMLPGGESSPHRRTADGLYVLTNPLSWCSAAVILYPGVLDSYAEQHSCDWFVIPSSIHEFLLLPKRKKTDSQASLANEQQEAEKLSSIIQSVNKEELDVVDRLSDHLYIYSRAEKALKILS